MTWLSYTEEELTRDVLFEFHLNFGIPPVLVFQLEVYYKVDRFLTGLTAQQKGTPAQSMVFK